MFRVSRTRARKAIWLCALTMPMMLQATAAGAQSKTCASALNHPCPVATPTIEPAVSDMIASAQALRIAVSQIDGPISSRVRALSEGHADPIATLNPDRHYKVLALGNAGQSFNAADPEIEKIKKKLGLDPFRNPIKPRFGVWTDGSWSRLSFDDAGSNFKGEIWSGIGGIDYVVADRLTLGVAGSYENQDYDRSLGNASVQGAGITAAPYAVVRLDNNFSVDASGGRSWLDYDSSRPGSSAQAHGDRDIAATRWFGAANFNANYAIDQWRLEGRVGSIYACETQESLRPGIGDKTADQAMAVGRLRLAYEFPILDGLQPYVSAIGRYAYMQGEATDRTEAIFGAGASLRAGRALVGIGGTTLESHDTARNYTANLNISFGL